MGQNTGDYVVIIIVVGALTIGLISMAIGWAVQAWDALINWRPVNHSAPPAPAVMSRAAPDPAVDLLSSKDGRTDDEPDAPQITRDDLITFYSILRKHGIGREEIRPALKAVGLPLSNDLWTKAAPPAPQVEPGDKYQTPIAERPTNAVF